LEESKGALELRDMFIILPNLLDPASGYEFPDGKPYKSSKRAKVGDYSSKDVKKMPVAAIKKLLVSNGDLKFD
jgi:hypothetical protein